MSFLKRPSFRLGSLGLLLIFVVFSIKSQYGHSQTGQLATSPLLNAPPSSGRAENDTGGKVPGNPDQTIANIHKIYAAIGVYRQRHGNKYPPNVSALMDDILADCIAQPPGQAYGFKDGKNAREYLKESVSLFLNPDSRYADDPVARHSLSNVVAYIMTDKRPDGTLIGDALASGKRDVLLSTDIYVHQNSVIYPKAHSTTNPVGFYVVLWNDGVVQKVPYDQILYVPKGDGDFTHAFPGQAGVPSNALTYDQYYKLIGWKNGGPRGSVGGKGQSYNGKTYP